MSIYTNKALAGLKASLAADSLSLGPHWIYDTALIEQRFGRIESLSAPGPDSYHKNRTAGDFTHYGDQTFALLKAVSESRGFTVEAWFGTWKRLMSGYDGYVDGATRNTLSRIDYGDGPDGCGSNSSDLAGASRIAPVILAHHDDLEALVDAARLQTRLTHNNILVLESAEFFARTAHGVIHGASPIEAMQQATKANYVSAPVTDWLEKGLALKETDSVAAIAQFGQSCNVNGAFPGVVQIIARHEDNLAEALTVNAMAGGDSAARGLLIGLILGAALDQEALPAQWFNGLNKAADIERLAGALL
ncbi:ADP-ribosylglycohydrolase family protein [Desulfovibrio ferrophilus]|uniref:ADP-ribosylglycohydrolase n=1 Tax=Desulfovibrio ferrophilus TaxID=241368 RepID=A0A2Z6AZS4_9BACT|nr:ADP-ribosylglycohydrolase family protein [Desulfovibrio ferrophilus]BBD08685.1 ADP-ribosylglycohydrolase [Desulfovibrio ferrophilus]